VQILVLFRLLLVSRCCSNDVTPVLQLQWFEEVRDGEGGAVVLQEMVAVSAAAAAQNAGARKKKNSRFDGGKWWRNKVRADAILCGDGGGAAVAADGDALVDRALLQVRRREDGRRWHCHGERDGGQKRCWNVNGGCRRCR